MNLLTLLKIYFRSKQENNEELKEETKDKNSEEVDDQYVWILEKGMIISEYLKL